MKKLFLLLLLITPHQLTAETTCVEDSPNPGDVTCTTTTTTNISGTTTGNILNNSTFGTGTTTSTSGWSTDGDEGIHTHGVGEFGQKYNGYVDQGGTLAFHGHEDDNVYQDVDLVGDGHLTKSQINEGFTSTMSADIWFWNNVENTTTLKQTITDDNGNVTTQIRNINDDGGNRSWNSGAYVNYTDSYTHNSNTQAEFTIRAEVYNNTAGTTYDSGHWGPDVDNVQLSVTTSGTTSTSSSSTTTFCYDRTPNTCPEIIDDSTMATISSVGTTDDGQTYDEMINTSVTNSVEVKYEEPTIDMGNIVSVETTVLEIDADGNVKETDMEKFFEESFTLMLEENNLVEEFDNALQDEGITKEEFFEETVSMIEESFEEPMNTFSEEPKTEMKEPEAMEEEVVQSEEPVATENNSIETSSGPTMEENKPTEEVSSSENETVSTEENANEEVATENEQPTTEENNTNATETTAQSEETSNEGDTETETETVSNESSMDEDTTSENTPTQEGGEETVVAEDTSVSESATEAESIGAKIEKIIAKLEAKLKKVSDRVRAVQVVTLKGMQTDGPNLSSYSKPIYQNQRMIGVPNPDFFQTINILEQQQIYSDASLVAYTGNDPIAVKQGVLREIHNEKLRVLQELKELKRGS